MKLNDWAYPNARTVADPDATRPTLSQALRRKARLDAIRAEIKAERAQEKILREALLQALLVEGIGEDAPEMVQLYYAGWCAQRAVTRRVEDRLDAAGDDDDL